MPDQSMNLRERLMNTPFPLQAHLGILIIERL
jgi:hypothetical protein